MPRPRDLVNTSIIALAASAAIVTSAQTADLVWARDGDIDSLDPHRATSTLSMQV